MIKRIAVLTGGGDVPGLNSVIKGVVYRGSELGMDVTGIRRGWEGLTHVNLDDTTSRDRYVMPLRRSNTRTIDRTGGTMLHTSRTNPSKMKAVPDFLDAAQFPTTERKAKDGTVSTTYNMTSQVVKNLERLGIECLIAIGGDDTLSYAAQLHQAGFKVVAIPKTMDNDVRNTEYCIGFSTAITRATDAINRQRSTVGSHERIGVFRIFGRDAGFTALFTSYVTALRCAIPEHRFDFERLMELLLQDKRNNPSNYAMVVLSEGAEWVGYELRHVGEADAYGHRKKANVAEDFADELRKRTKEDSITSDLTYDLRSGEADFLDKLVATTFGNMALDAITDNQFGQMTAVADGKFVLAPIPDPGLGPRCVDVKSMYNVDRFRANYSGKVGLPIFLTRL